MQELFFQESLQPFFQLLLALCLGALLGLEREYKGREAGLRTYALVALGSALFVLAAREAFLQLGNTAGVRLDLGNVIGAVAVGLGFLGAGLIWRRETHIEGLTSAAGIWATGAIGTLVGLGFYGFAIFATVLVLFVLSGLQIFETKILHKGS